MIGGRRSARGGTALALAAVAIGSTAGAADGGTGVTSSGYLYATACPQAGLRDLPDRWLMDECNCTSYAAWALSANGQRTDWFVPGRMDARNWPAVAAAAGLRVDRRPEAGAIAVWPDEAPPFGHVAYVTAVHPRGGFDVAEYNLPVVLGGRVLAFDTRHGLLPGTVEFVHVPRAATR